MIRLTTFARISRGWPTVSLALLLGWAPGCGNKTAPSESARSAAQEAPEAILSAFKEAKPEVKAAADQIVTAVKTTGTPVWYLLAKNEGHDFTQQTLNLQLYETVMFVNEFLLK